ncbi:MAG: hydrolase [Sneathiella sp.]|nr:hydrolase [Sneathiella sp.]
MSLPPFLSSIDEQKDQMIHDVLSWSNINSGSLNLLGLERMAYTLRKAFEITGASGEVLPSDPMTVITDTGAEQQIKVGPILRIVKRPEANRQILLCGHMDTVFDTSSDFQTWEDLGGGKIRGPGVTDMKGGLRVILAALQAFEQSPHKDQLGWEVLINADEEIGSFGSRRHLVEAAGRANLGLVYEPSMPDGTLAGARKGSGNFTLVVTGKAAHAGREHHLGRNAITALSSMILDLNSLTGGRPDLTVNIGKIEGGGALNVVPDLAICRFNVRMKEPSDQDWLQDAMDSIVAKMNNKADYTAILHGSFSRPPKPMSPMITQLFDLVRMCGSDLGIEIKQQPTGGCCDGNNLAAAGLPNIDTLGVRGANIHSNQEFIITDSLTERAKLTALILHKLSSGNIPFPKKAPAS